MSLVDLKVDSKDQKRLRILRQMKFFATGLLVMMVLLYILSKSFEKTYPFFGALAAFSESAMVGALADWFAVTALFRRPLKLPIPHTAVIPRNKDRFGYNLSRFIRDNFLSQEAVENKLRSIDFAEWIVDSLCDNKNIEYLSHKVGLYLQKSVNKLDEKELKKFVMEVLMKNLSNITILPFFGKVLESFVEENRHQEVLNQILSTIEKMLNENKTKLLGNMRKENPWWMPNFIDNIIIKRVINKLEQNLKLMRNDKKHEIRNDFNRLIYRLINTLKDTETTSLTELKIKTDFLFVG